MKYLILLLFLTSCSTTQSCFDRTLDFLGGSDNIGWLLVNKGVFKFYSWRQVDNNIEYIMISPISRKTIEQKTKLKYESNCKNNSDYLSVYTLTVKPSEYGQ